MKNKNMEINNNAVFNRYSGWDESMYNFKINKCFLTKSIIRAMEQNDIDFFSINYSFDRVWCLRTSMRCSLNLTNEMFMCLVRNLDWRSELYNTYKHWLYTWVRREFYIKYPQYNYLDNYDLDLIWYFNMICSTRGRSAEYKMNATNECINFHNEYIKISLLKKYSKTLWMREIKS